MALSFHICWFILISRWWHKPFGITGYMLLQNELRKLLFREQAQPKDSGHYKCQAKNHGGSGEDNIEINILCNMLTLFNIKITWIQH